jgi:hypothetical protein
MSARLSTGLPLACSGTHIRRRAEDHARHGRVHRDRRRHRGAAGGRDRRIHRFREAEVEHLHRAVGPQLDVGWLEIAVDDALVVRGAKRIGDLAGNGERFVDRERPLLDPLGQRRSVHHLEDERSVAVERFHPIDRGDIRMIEGGEHLRFAFEPGEAVRIVGDRRQENLDGDVTIEPRVAGAIHRAHSAFTECCEDFECAQAGARGQRQHGGRGDCSRHQLPSRVAAAAEVDLSALGGGDVREAFRRSA